jgi:hypothetical protein
MSEVTRLAKEVRQLVEMKGGVTDPDVTEYFEEEDGSRPLDCKWEGGWDVPLAVDANPIIKNKTSVAANVSSLWRRLSIYTSPMGLPLKKKTKTYMLVMEGDEGMIIPWIVKSTERRIARLNKGTPRNPSLMLENWELLLVTKNGDNQLGTEDKLTQETPESITTRKLVIYHRHILMKITQGWVVVCHVWKKKKTGRVSTCPAWDP